MAKRRPFFSFRNEAAFRWIAVTLFAVFLTSCGCSNRKQAPVAEDKAGKAANSGTAETADSSANPGMIDAANAKPIGTFSFVDHEGNEFSEENVKNRLTIASFVFTRCPGTCPQQSAAMQALQKRLLSTATEQVQLLTITVDPEYDTAEVLAEYGKSLEADFEVWKFVTGDKDRIWDFSRNRLGMAVSENPSDPLIPIAHESQFVLIDRTGRIRGYFDALSDEGVEALWVAVDEVLPEFAPDEALVNRYSFPATVRHMAQPPGILDDEWMKEVASKEIAALQKANAVPSFRFEECGEQLGLTIAPQIVDDQRHRLLVNHYDHGNGVSVADVDGDGILDMYFTSQVGPNQLMRGTSDGSFEDITFHSGAGVGDRVSVAGSFCDVDNDGDPDLFVTSIRSSNVFLENVGGGKFVDRTEESGLSYTGHSSKGTFFDYDKDGLADLFVCNVGKFTTEELTIVRNDICNSQADTEQLYFVGRPDAFGGHLVPELGECSRLYRNLGDNTFEDVTEKLGLENDFNWSGDAVAFDANNDSWPDLYVCNMQGHDRLYINQEGTGFRDETNDYFAATPWGTMGVAVADFDNNGRFDIFLTDMHSDMSVDVGPDKEKLKSEIAWPEEFLVSEGRSIYGNAFFRQSEDGTFEEVSDQRHAENYWPWGLSYADINSDGFQDAFLTSSMCFPYRYCTNSLLLNHNGDRFFDAHFTTEIEPRRKGEQIAPWFGLNFDTEDSDSKLRKSRTGEWVVWSATGSRSSAVFDIDDDGDLDIVTNEFNTRPQVLRSNLHAKNPNYLKVELRGTQCTRDALGAVVTVEAGELKQSQLNSGTTGYLAQSVMPLYFGLGDNDSIDRVVVRWPNGESQVIAGPIEPNQKLQVVEDTSAN